MTRGLVSPEDLPYIIEQAQQATYRNAFDWELDIEVSELNLVAYMQEFFPLEESPKHQIWEVVNQTIDRIENLREAFNEVR